MAKADRYLLDTHALIWWWLGDPALSRQARKLMEADGHTIMVSAVSGYEIALKVARGQLPALAEPLSRFDENVIEAGFAHLPVIHEHAVSAGLLEGQHRDPFDRIIAAQGLAEQLTVITRDPALAAFGCKVLW